MSRYNTVDPVVINAIRRINETENTVFKMMDMIERQQNYIERLTDDVSDLRRIILDLAPGCEVVEAGHSDYDVPEETHGREFYHPW